jgi:hypothetical protein
MMNDIEKAAADKKAADDHANKTVADAKPKTA